MEQITDPCKNMNESKTFGTPEANVTLRANSMKKKLASERNQRLKPSVPTVRFHLCEISGEAQLNRQETDRRVPEPGSGLSRLTTEEREGTFWSDGHILCLD